MPYKEVWVDDAEIEEFEDIDLIEELESRGYLITKKSEDHLDQEIEDVVWHFRNGRKKDALIVLERIYPELYGLSNLV
jgi:hypothetical protein